MSATPRQGSYQPALPRVSSGCLFSPRATHVTWPPCGATAPRLTRCPVQHTTLSSGDAHAGIPAAGGRPGHARELAGPALQPVVVLAHARARAHATHLARNNAGDA